jgi:hypothetical protein
MPSSLPTSRPIVSTPVCPPDIIFVTEEVFFEEVLGAAGFSFAGA